MFGLKTNRLNVRSATKARSRRLTKEQLLHRKRAQAQKDHVLLGAWTANCFLPFAHQGGFGAPLKSIIENGVEAPNFNHKHIAGREELSLSSLQKTVWGGAILDIDLTNLSNNSSRDLVLHHDAAIGRTTGPRPGTLAAPSPDIGMLTIAQLRDYGIHLIGGGYADILTFSQFMDHFADQPFSLETKTRTAAVHLIAFVDSLSAVERNKFLDRAVIAAIARPIDESKLGPKLSTQEPTEILREGLGDSAVIACSAKKTALFTLAYGVPLLSWLYRLVGSKRTPVLTGDTLGAPVTGMTELPGIGKLPVFRSIPTITATLVKVAHKQGVFVFPWTVDTKAGINRIAELGADGVFSDDPVILAQIMEEMDAVAGIGQGKSG